MRIAADEAVSAIVEHLNDDTQTPVQRLMRAREVINTAQLPINIFQDVSQRPRTKKKKKRIVQPRVDGSPTNIKKLDEALEAKVKVKEETAKVKAEAAKVRAETAKIKAEAGLVKATAMAAAAAAKASVRDLGAPLTSPKQRAKASEAIATAPGAPNKAKMPAKASRGKPSPSVLFAKKSKM